MDPILGQAAHRAWLLVQPLRMPLLEMARFFLSHLRVHSPLELKARILKGIDEMNAAPVVFRWKIFDLEVV